MSEETGTELSPQVNEAQKPLNTWLSYADDLDAARAKRRGHRDLLKKGHRVGNAAGIAALLGVVAIMIIAQETVVRLIAVAIAAAVILLAVVVRLHIGRWVNRFNTDSAEMLKMFDTAEEAMRRFMHVNYASFRALDAYWYLKAERGDVNSASMREIEGWAEPDGHSFTIMIGYSPEKGWLVTVDGIQSLNARSLAEVDSYIAQYITSVVDARESTLTAVRSRAGRAELDLQQSRDLLAAFNGSTSTPVQV